MPEKNSIDYVVYVDSHGSFDDAKPKNLPKILYKYRAFNQFSVKSLAGDTVYFAKPESFNDPFECRKFLDEEAIEKMVASATRKPFDGKTLEREHLLIYAKGPFNREIDESGILSLCRTAENPAMWSYYGADESRVGLKGFAIGYDTAKLVSSLCPLAPGLREDDPERRRRYVFDIAYKLKQPLPRLDLLIEGNHKNLGSDFQKMFATKSTSFQHEDEVRIVIPPSSDLPILFKLHGESDNVFLARKYFKSLYIWSGHGTYRHSHDAIKEIIFGDEIDPAFEKTIRAILDDRKDIEYFRAKLERREYKIRRHPVS